MKKFYLFLTLFLFCLLTGISCKNAKTNNETDLLCQRNVYSRNGVESVLTYDFSIIENEIDLQSKKLHSIERYDSLGNLIYYKGESYPYHLYEAFGASHDAILEGLGLPLYSGIISTYKFDYSDSTLRAIAYINEKGDCPARVVHKEDDSSLIDSVFIHDQLYYVHQILKDTRGRDSVDITYDRKYTVDMILESEIRSTYTQINDTTERECYSYKDRDDDFGATNRKYNTSSDFVDRFYDSHGRMVGYTTSDGGSRILSYGKFGLESNEIRSPFLGNILTIYEYDRRGLLMKETTMDNSILQDYNEYEYSFYPYGLE